MKSLTFRRSTKVWVAVAASAVALAATSIGGLSTATAANPCVQQGEDAGGHFFAIDCSFTITGIGGGVSLTTCVTVRATRTCQGPRSVALPKGSVASLNIDGAGRGENLTVSPAGGPCEEGSEPGGIKLTWAGGSLSHLSVELASPAGFVKHEEGRLDDPAAPLEVDISTCVETPEIPGA